MRERFPLRRSLVAGLVLGVTGDALLRAPGPPGLNMFLWVAAIAVAAYVLQRRAGLELDQERVAWLASAVLFAAGLAWRDSPPLKLLALGCATFGFALAAYRVGAAWVRRASVFRYVGHGGRVRCTRGARRRSSSWTRPDRHGVLTSAGRPGWRRAAAVARGLVIATPLVVVFGALFMSADAVFADLVLNMVRIDVDPIASHLVLFSVCAWLGTGYLRGWMTGTELPPLRVLWRDSALLDLDRDARRSGSRKSRRRWRRSTCCSCCSSSCSSVTCSAATRSSRSRPT